MFARMTIDETRTVCKEKIESLEFWLRRLIDSTLASKFGAAYFDASDATGVPIFGSKVKAHALTRMRAEPARYQRSIDTLLLEDEARTVCKFFPDFKDALAGAFHNREAARQCFDRIIGARNPLYHANSITLRQAEQVCCYCNDILDSLKRYYSTQGMAYQYDAPLIIRFADSCGNTRHRQSGSEMHDFNHGFMDDPRSLLRVGDRLTVEVEIDPAYDPASYHITWASTQLLPTEYGSGPSFALTLTERQVGANFGLQCRVVSNRVWHRKGSHDDFLIAYYRVMPN